MSPDDPKDVVRRGYDAVSHAYRRDDFELEGTGYARFLAWVEGQAAPGARVLDLGCGCGVPVARHLARLGCEVIGVDISEVQIDRARRNVPDAEFRCLDFMTFDPGDRRFDVVVAFYSIFHVPLADQRTLFERIGAWTAPAGLFLGTVGNEDAPGYVEENWLGVKGATMFWSHASEGIYRGWLVDAGFEILRQDVLIDGSGQRHPVLLASKTALDRQA